jgi:hypothetical protein
VVSLKLQKRLAASILGCGKNKVWVDPNEISVVGMSTTRKCLRVSCWAAVDLLELLRYICGGGLLVGFSVRLRCFE